MYDGDGENSSLVGASPARSDAVLLRCRDTIERLHGEVEDERSRRKELHQQVFSLETDLQAVRAELAAEKSKHSELEARAARLERRSTDAEAKLQLQKDARETAGDQLQKAKADAVQKGQELFAKGLRVTELEAAVKRAEARANASQNELTHITQELETTSERLTTCENELAQLRATVDTEITRAERAVRVSEERERLCEALQRDLDDLQERLSHVDADFRSQQGNWRQQEMDLRSEAGQSVTEAGELRRRLVDQETESSKLERRAGQLQGELAASQAQLLAVQLESRRASEDLAKVQAELEAAKEQVRRLNQILKDERVDWEEQLQREVSEKDRLQTQVLKFERQAGDAQRDLQRSLDQHDAQMSHLTDVSTRERQDLLDEKGGLESSYQQALLQIAEYRSEQALLEETRAQEAHDQQVAALEKKEAQTQAAELTWRLEQTNNELGRSKEALKKEQEKTRSAQAAAATSRKDAEKARHMLEKAESTHKTVEDDLKHRGNESSALAELLQQARRHSADMQQEFTLMRQEMQERTLAVELKNKEVLQEAARYEDAMARIRDMEHQTVESAKAAAIDNKVAESRGEGMAEERLRASEAAAEVRIREIELTSQEKLRAVEIDAAVKLKEAGDKALAKLGTGSQIEESHRNDIANLKASFRVQEAAAEAAIKKTMEAKIENIKTKYEQKMSKLYRHLSEREAYENKLKAVIENEVDVLHHSNSDLDHRSMKKLDRHAVEDYVVDRMAGMADKVERRILRSLRHPERR